MNVAVGCLAVGLRAPRRPIPGRELASDVVTVGSTVRRFGVGNSARS